MSYEDENSPLFFGETASAVVEQTERAIDRRIDAIGGSDWDSQLAKRIEHELDRVTEFVKAQRPIITTWKEGLVNHVRNAVAARRLYLKNRR